MFSVWLSRSASGYHLSPLDVPSRPWSWLLAFPLLVTHDLFVYVAVANENFRNTIN
jgi:hypothetical protein